MKTTTIHIFLFIFGVLMVKTLASPISKAQDFFDQLLGTLEAAFEEDSYGYGCSDNNENCAYWAQTGECSNNPAYMSENCCQSCNNGGSSGSSGRSIPSGSSGSSGGFAQGQLQRHNSLRARHGSPPMRLDSSLSSAAESYAQQLASRGTMDLVHSGVSGENLFVYCDSRGGGGEKATDDWYNEISQYNFGNPGFGWNTGHFTQVVWKGSTRLGIGKATGYVDGMPCEFVVGRYSPAGNLEGAFRANVQQ